MDNMNHGTAPQLKPENDMSFVTSSWMSPSATESRLAADAERFALGRFSVAADEVVVVDERSATSPSQAVENRLVALLRDASLPVSHLQIRGFGRGRGDSSRD